MFEAIMCELLQGMVILNEQISLRPSSCLLPINLGKCEYNIQVFNGDLRLNHSALNPDGFSWSAPPRDCQQEYYNLKEGNSYTIKLIVQENFGYLDRIEVVNVSFTKFAKFVYQVNYILT